MVIEVEPHVAGGVADSGKVCAFWARWNVKYRAVIISRNLHNVGKMMVLKRQTLEQVSYDG